VVPGTPVTFTLFYSPTNIALGDTNVSITDSLPAGFKALSATAIPNFPGGPTNPDGFTIPPPATVLGATSVNFTAAAVAPLSADTFEVVAQAPSNLTPPATNTVNETSTMDVGTLSSSTTITAVTPVADMAVTTTGASSVTAGTTDTYTITLTNKGPSDAAGVVLTDNLATVPIFGAGSAITPAAGNPDAFTSATGPGIFTETANAPIPAGNVDQFIVTSPILASAASGASFTDKQSVASTTTDPDLSNNSSSITVAVATAADVSVTKTGPATITAGTTVTYTLTVTNSGPSDAQNVNLSDALPAGLSFIGPVTQVAGTDAFTDTSTGNTPSVNLPTLPNGSTDSFQVVAFAASSLANGAKLSDTASVSAATTDTNLTNNSFTLASTVATSTFLNLSQTAPANATAGANITYSITVMNAGPSDAAGVVVTDTLPAGVTFVSEQQVAGTDAFVLSHTTTGATFSAATVVAGNTDTIELVGLISPSTASGTMLTNNTTITSTTTNTNPVTTAPGTTTVMTSADLAVTKTGPATITAGTSITYTLTLTNLGPSDSLNVTLTDALPAGLTLVSEAQVSGTDTFTDMSAGNTASFTAGTVASGSTDVFHVVAAAASSTTSGTAFMDTATVSSATTPDPNAANDSSLFTTTATTSADLAVVNTGPPTITAGTTITYTIRATNSGPSDAVNVTLSDTLPAGFTLSSLTGLTTNPDGFAPAGSSTVFAATMAAGNTDVFQVVAVAASNLVAGSMVSDTANISSAGTPDPNTTNNTSISTAAIVTAASVSVAKTGPNTVTAGTTITYTITVANTGPSDAQAVVLSDTLPAGVTFQSITPAPTNPDNFTPFTLVGGVVSSPAAGVTVAAGNTDVFTLVVAVPSNAAGGTMLTDTAAVTTTTTNTSSQVTSVVTTTVATTANVSITETGPATATEGDTVTYSLTLTNTGPSDAAGVVVTDVLPAGAGLVSATLGGVTGVQSGNTITFNLGTVPASAVATVTGTVGVTFGEDGGLTNTATVTSTTTNTSAMTKATVATAVAEGTINLTSLAIKGTEGTPLVAVPVATFTHASGVEPASAFQATINWGDGTSSAGTITQSGTTYTVSGSHTYNTDGTFSVTTTVSEAPTEPSSTAQGTQTATIAEAPLPPGVSNTALNNHIFELLETLFHAQPTAFQINILDTTIMAAEASAFVQLSNSGVDPATALFLVQSLGQSQFDFFATILAGIGTSLESAVSDLAFGFLTESQSEVLGPA
jgi:uncharacterized repeat protein (TIGR01451 family)